jgi:hypothetical protein
MTPALKIPPHAFAVSARHIFVISLFAATLSASVARAQEAAPSNPRPPAPAVKKPWGAELELVQPFIPEVGIFTAKGTRTLWGSDGGLKGDAIVGVFLRPGVDHNVVDEIDEYAAILGYRQYFWRGLHAEALTYLGWARGTRNKKDGKNYEDFAWLAEVSAGYRFTIVDGSSLSLYVTPQVGYLQGVYTNIGPRDTPDRFLTAKLLLGAQF